MSTAAAVAAAAAALRLEEALFAPAQHPRGRGGKFTQGQAAAVQPRRPQRRPGQAVERAGARRHLVRPVSAQGALSALQHTTLADLQWRAAKSNQSLVPLASKALPLIQRLWGANLVVDTSRPMTPNMAMQVAGLAHFPPQLLSYLRGHDFLALTLGYGPVTSAEGFTAAASMPARGSPVPLSALGGATQLAPGPVASAVNVTAGSDSISTVLHELGHALGHAAGLSLGGNPALVAAQKRMPTTMADYSYWQMPDGAGEDELLAESIASVLANGRSEFEFADDQLHQYVAGELAAMH